MQRRGEGENGPRASGMMVTIYISLITGMMIWRKLTKSYGEPRKKAYADVIIDDSLEKYNCQIT